MVTVSENKDFYFSMPLDFYIVNDVFESTFNDNKCHPSEQF